MRCCSFSLAAFLVVQSSLSPRSVSQEVKITRQPANASASLTNERAQMKENAETFLSRRTLRHVQCVELWTQARPMEKGSSISFWGPNPQASDRASACIRSGGRPFFLRSVANDSSLFPEESGVCMPEACDADFLREYAVPYIVIGTMLNSGVPVMDAPSMQKAVQAAKVKVEKIMVPPFPDAPGIDFVIVGFPSSGTTTLAHELRQHPRIVIPDHEDPFFWVNVFTSSTARKWSRKYKAKLEEKQAHLPKWRRVLVGIKEPLMVMSETAMNNVAKMPNIKVIVLLREPISLLQSWIRHAVDWINPHGDAIPICALLQYRVISTFVLPLIPRDRLLLVPTEAMRRDPHFTSQRILDFLGVAPVEGHVPFAHKSWQNRWDSEFCSVVGRCFTFCRSKGSDILPVLHAAVAPEVVLLEQLLAQDGWPSHLHGLQRRWFCPHPPLRETRAAAVSEERPGLCQLNPERSRLCFASLDECQQCCEQHQGPCAWYGDHWRTCCESMQLQSLLDSLLRIRHRCSRTGMSGPCCLGKGRLRLAVTP